MTRLPDPIRRDQIDPTSVRNRIEAEAAELAERHGGRPSDFALGLYRSAYAHIHESYVDLLERSEATSIEFWPDDRATIDAGLAPNTDRLEDLDAILMELDR